MHHVTLYCVFERLSLLRSSLHTRKAKSSFTKAIHIIEKNIYKRKGIAHAVIDAFKCINTLLIFGIGRTKLDKSPRNRNPYMAVFHIHPWQLLLS